MQHIKHNELKCNFISDSLSEIEAQVRYARAAGSHLCEC